MPGALKRLAELEKKAAGVVESLPAPDPKAGDGKGGKDRRTMLPQAVKRELADNLRRVKALHERDLARGLG